MSLGATPFTRRRFLGYAGAVGAASLFPALPSWGEGGKRVAVFGAGVAGLTAAHELAERGFDVTVYERRAGGLGGKARSMGVPGTETPGRAPLPGEHGFRFFPGFYQNLPDTMRRIPFGSNPNGVYDNLVDATQFAFSRAGGPDLILPTGLVFKPEDWTPAKFFESLEAVLTELLVLPTVEAGFFARQILIFFTSCDARRFGQWEWTTWWDFIGAEHASEEYRAMLARGLTKNLAAAKETVASVNAMGTVGEAFLYNLFGIGYQGHADRVLNAPTNDAFIDPWINHLQSLGAQFRDGCELTALQLAGSQITGATVAGPNGLESVDADWYVVALPVERARELWNDAVLAADPYLAKMVDVQTDWMTGIQYFLNQRVPVVTGHISYVDSPWALTSISQAQFWNHDFGATYGDGRAVECLSIDVSDWSTPGILYGKPAWACTPDEIAAEVWSQLKAHLADRDAGALTDDMLVSWFLDPGIVYPPTPPTPDRIADNEDPLLINNVGAWYSRPDAVTAIPNLFLAGDYVRTNISVATMEAANESGRRAANGILKAAGSAASPANIYALYRPPEWELLKQIDEQRYRYGQPHLLETVDALLLDSQEAVEQAAGLVNQVVAPVQAIVDQTVTGLLGPLRR